MKFSTTHIVMLIAIVVVLVLIFVMSRNKKKEGFSIGNLFGKVKNTVGGVVGKVKNVVKPPGFKPTYVNRSWDGRVWACPEGTTDYGDQEKQCLVSPYGPQLWRNGPGGWGWSCPNGTAPNNSDDWNQKCVQGYAMRKNIGGQWRCTDTEVDTGATWENSDWFSAQKQCDRGNNRVFTRRVNINGKWQCPEGTIDTGRTWDDGENGGKQCQYIGG